MNENPEWHRVSILSRHLPFSVLDIEPLSDEDMPLGFVIADEDGFEEVCVGDTGVYAVCGRTRLER